MIKLLQIYLTGLLGINEGLKTKDRGKKWRNLSMPVVMVYAFIVMLGLYSFQLYQSLEMLEAVGMVPELLSIGIFTTLLFCLFGSWGKAPNLIFMGQDLPFWLSSPLSTRTVFLGKALIAYLFEAGASLFFMAPPLFFVGRYLEAGVGFYVLGILGAIVLPLPIFLIGTVLGTLTQLLFKGVSSRKNLLKLGLYMVGTLLLVGGSFMVGGSWWNEMWERFVAYVAGASWLQVFVSHYRALLLDFTVARGLLFFGIHLLLFALFVEVGSKHYFSLVGLFGASHGTRGSGKVSYGGNSALVALYKREFRRYFSSSIYVLNTLIGQLLLVAGAVFLSINSDFAVMALPLLEAELGISGLGMVPIVLAVAMMVSMMPTTSSSLSLEGKGFAMLKGFPVEVGTIFTAKLGVNLTLSLMAVLIALPLFIWRLPFSVVEALFFVWITLGYVVLSALIGLLANLRLPNLDWTAEVTVVKQSASVMVSLFGNMLAVAVPAYLGIGVLGLGATVLLWWLAGFVTLTAVVALVVLHKFGRDWFMKIGD